jgi:hypothetical protein
MPSGGKLTIETQNTFLDESYAATDAEVRAGQYVVISVSDTGSAPNRQLGLDALPPANGWQLERVS